MDGRRNCLFTDKKISGSFARRSGNGTKKQKRAGYYDEEKKDAKRSGSSEASAIIETKFKNKNLIYLCLKFLDYFKKEPESFEQLLDGLDYLEVQSDIQAYQTAQANFSMLANKR